MPSGFALFGRRSRAGTGRGYSQSGGQLRFLPLREQALADRLRLDAALLLGHDPAEWTVLRTYRVPFAQFAQPPGSHGRLPMNRTGAPGLYLASEATVDSSQNGAVLSGEAAARAVLADLGW